MNNKTTNKSIIKTLGILAILVFNVIIALPVKAQDAWVDGCSNCYYYVNPNNNNYYGNNNQSNNQFNSVPIIYSITPNGVDLSTIVGNGNMAVILNGANFVPGSIAEFDNTYRNTTFNSSGQLTVILTAPDLAVAKSYAVTVFNPAPGGGISNSISFNIKTATIAPVTVVSPSVSPTPAVSPKVSKPVTVSASTSLTANSIFAGNGFMPSNFFQWLMALILIILIAIVARKAFVGNDYQNTPLKHA